MTYKFDGYNYLVRLQRGEQLVSSLNELAEKENLDGAWLQAVGGAEKLTLGFYDLEAQEYRWQDFEELVEIASLSGNLAWVEGKPYWHLHGVFGDREYRSLSGHVRDLTVGGTCEIFIHPLREKITRSPDDETGLKLLDI
jgi:uncharacterized protein